MKIILKLYIEIYLKQPFFSRTHTSLVTLRRVYLWGLAHLLDLPSFVLLGKHFCKGSSSVS